MWGRRGPADAAATKEAAKAARQRALSAVEDLLRRAEWEGLSEAERATLLSAYATLDMSGPHSASPMSGRAADGVFQEWVARLVAPRFQEEVAAVVRGWLDAASPDSHLFVGGSAGQGRRSLVASLARQAMAQRPAPPEYCYVPQPAAMDRPVILELPSGAGKAFTKALQEALKTVGQEPDSDDHTDENAVRAARTQQVVTTFDALAGAAPAQAREYLTQLRAAIDTALASDDGLPFANGDAPIWYATSNSADAASDRAGSGAPVVLASLVQTELVDALLRANGGVLVLSAADLLLVNGAWPTLFSALAARALPLKDGWPSLPLAARVVVVGPGDTYRGLLESSDDFSRLFRYEVWTNPLVDWTRETEAAYACLADGVTRRYALPAFDLSGVARLIEEGGRRAINLNRTHLTTDLLLLHDLVVEAGRAAQARSATATTGGDLEAALLTRRTQQAMYARLVHSAILSGQEITPTSGAAVGQINGLAIYELHPTEGSFAVPVRISATVSPGREAQLVDIEHEAEQADSDHVRGALTVQGYLAQKYGQARPVSVVGRIRFEQEHDTTGGDSASLAVLVALLSALAQAPIRLSLAITGAVGQYGEIQPIGGVNTKIEGLWDLCRMRRAQGEQVDGGYGVLIPAVNARDLMLRSDVAESIGREGWFHVWPVSTVDDALTLLTGVPAEEIHRRVDERLRHFHEAATQDRRGR